jgi:flagellar motor switch protein FliN/FliY
LASDISNIIKSEIISTLESLLSVSGSVEEIKLLDGNFDSESCVKTTVTFEYSDSSGIWNFYIPASTATKFEYLMLGGVTEQKETIDDEIKDAIQEIVSTISGSITTSVNAQGFDDISGMKFSVNNNVISTCDDVDSDFQMYEFQIKLNDETLKLFISFNSNMTQFITALTGSVPLDDGDANTASSSMVSNFGSNNMLSSILGEESIDNLKILFDIKMRLSVRLGTKTCLLRDVISWDIGEIIELSQMTSEPLEILVNGVVIGTGEAIIVDGKFGVKIKTISRSKEN